jgi:hypothetical protein
MGFAHLSSARPVPVIAYGQTTRARISYPCRASKAIRAHLRKRAIKAVIPEPAGQARSRRARGRNGGRLALYAEAYNPVP